MGPLLALKGIDKAFPGVRALQAAGKEDIGCRI